MKPDIHPRTRTTTVTLHAAAARSRPAAPRRTASSMPTSARSATRSTRASRRSSTPAAASPSARAATARRPPRVASSPAPARVGRVSPRRAVGPRPAPGLFSGPVRRDQEEVARCSSPASSLSIEYATSSSSWPTPTVHGDQAAARQLGRRYARARARSSPPTASGWPPATISPAARELGEPTIRPSPPKSSRSRRAPRPPAAAHAALLPARPHGRQGRHRRGQGR